MPDVALGLDFGTESARALLVDVASGEVLATAIQTYPSGVIDDRLLGRIPLPHDWALQDSDDWLAALQATIPAVLAESGTPPENVVGLGIDFTACTILPTTASGTPLCKLDTYRQHPHAWTKLWKHHAAQPQADRINELAAARGEPWLARYGGKISSEWLMPKALQLLEEAPGLFQAADYIVEGADWLVWQLTDTLTRNACAAGYKATWHKASGYPSPEFLAALHPEMETLYRDKMAGPVVAPGHRVGRLAAGWAARLGLVAGTPVAAPIIDAHAAVPGGGVDRPGVMFMIMGTSTCHMLMARQEMEVEGIAGVVEDGIAPGFFGYEAGQAGAGDIFAWFVEHAVPPAYHQEASERALSLHDLLTEKAAALAPGETGLLALDWWNGNRSTLVDAELSGLMLGYTLSTRAEEVYRALIEATAFGTRAIVEAFAEQNVPVDAIVTGGSLTRNPLLMQIYADVTGRDMAVTGAEQPSALGAAMLGAVAAGRQAGGCNSLAEASRCMAPPPARRYHPIPENHALYDTLYAGYRRLYDYFGRGENDIIKVLRRLRKASRLRTNTS